MTFTSALKAVTIPADKSEYDQILEAGMDRKGASTYFRDYVQELNREIALMSKLKGHSNIVSYEDHAILPHEDGIGWDILIRMELLRPINDEMRANHIFPRREVIRLGIDLCRALEVCQKYDIIHRDIKPANIFISETGDYKLGDFGVARIASASTGASTRAGTVNYMAPEVFRGEKYTSNVDIYSLGLVLYQLLNANRMPFYPPAPQVVTFAVAEQARARRLTGEALPLPCDAQDELGRIVCKACAPNPADRYASPAQLRRVLEAVMAARPQVPSAAANESRTVRLFTEPEKQRVDDGEARRRMEQEAEARRRAEEEQRRAAQQAAQAVRTARVPPAVPNPPAAPQKKKGNKLALVLGGVAAAAVVAAGCAALFLWGGSARKTPDRMVPGAAASQTAEDRTGSESAPDDLDVELYQDDKSIADDSASASEALGAAESMSLAEAGRAAADPAEKLPLGVAGLEEKGVRQEIIVEATGSNATLTLWTYRNGQWTEDMSAAAAIGSKGLTANKTEGDHMTPEGTFPVCFAFSTREKDTMLGFRTIREDSVWVCDPESRFYNTLQSKNNPEKDWADQSGAENMYVKFSKGSSNACICFGFNGDGSTAQSATAYAGSALFIDGVGESGNMNSGYGDIKISGKDMTELLSYLNSDYNPMIMIRAAR